MPNPQSRRPIQSDAITLVPLGARALRALSVGDLAEASRVSGFDLPEEFHEHSWLWQLRSAQLAEVPADEPWVAWVVARSDDRTVIGRSGFHAGPDTDGRVELSYCVLAAHRRRGYATSILEHLVSFARTHPDVTILRATISPDNVASLATLAKFPFVHVGEQMDDIDGRELIYELPTER